MVAASILITGTFFFGGGGMNLVLGIGSNLSMSASVCRFDSCASIGALQHSINAKITDGFIGVLHAPNLLRLQGGRCGKVFIFCIT
jgi:hypothetical protein